MKKNFLKLMMLGGLVSLASSLAVSCSPSGPQGGQTDELGNTFVETGTITPLRYTDMKYVAGAEGVSIEVISAENENIIFTCQPGADVVSYRLQIYPVSALNSALHNTLREEKLDRYTVEKCEEYIGRMINNEAHPFCGVLVNEESFGEDFFNTEFDWKNTKYPIWPISPLSDYVIVCQAYFDSKGKDMPGDLTMCHVKTPSMPLEGDPMIDFDIKEGFTSYAVTRIPNEDALGYFYHVNVASEIDGYIDAYGDDMFSQFLRHSGGLVLSNANIEEHVLYASDQPAVDQNGNLIDYCATALALDKNGTPAASVNRRDFNLRIAPSDPEPGKGIVHVPHKVSATVCQFSFELEKSASRMAFNVYPAAEADKIMAKPEAERRGLALRMVTGRGTEVNPGWVVVNDNFNINYDTNELTGTGFKAEQFQHELLPNTEHKIIYAFRNGYGNATDLFCTESFKTKPQVRDMPEKSVEDVQMYVDFSNRTAFSIDAKFSSEKTARIWWQYYHPDSPEDGYDLPDPAEIILADENRKNEFDLWNPEGMNCRMGEGKGKYTPNNCWIYWFLIYRDGFGNPWPNEIVDVYNPGQIIDNTYWDGFESGKKYYFAYIAEDWNGVLGPVKFFDGETKALVGGLNPTAEIKFGRKDQSGKVEVRFTSNDDTRSMKYCVMTDTGSQADKLEIYNLLEKDFGGRSYKWFMEKFEKFTTVDGLDSPNNTAYEDIDTNSNFDIAVAMVMPIGGLNAGEPVYGDFQVSVYVKKTGKTMTLAQYMGM